MKSSDLDGVLSVPWVCHWHVSARSPAFPRRHYICVGATGARTALYTLRDRETAATTHVDAILSPSARHRKSGKNRSNC